jgi:hypothetical protein
MTFIEWELFHVKITNFTVYEKLSINFIGTELGWHLLKGSSSTLRGRTWPFTKHAQSILLELSRGGIYWTETFLW